MVDDHTPYRALENYLTKSSKCGVSIGGLYSTIKSLVTDTFLYAPIG